VKIIKRKYTPGSLLVRIFFLSALSVTLWDFFQIQHAAFHLGFMTLTGFCLSIVGIYLRLVAVRTLGKYFSIELKTLQDHKLITQGVYKYIRHPAYLGTSLFGIGIPLIFSSLYGFLVMLPLIPCYLYRISHEENMLLEKLGDEYREYMKKTKKILPFLY
jgi:protein-S-isoprenylcysteine O-methyltransferase Ste14